MATQALQLTQLVGTVVSCTASLQAEVAPQDVLRQFSTPPISWAQLASLRDAATPVRALLLRTAPQAITRQDVAQALTECIAHLRATQELETTQVRQLDWAAAQLSPLAPNYLPAGMTLVGEDPALVHYYGIIESFMNSAGIFKVDQGRLRLLLLNSASERVSGYSRTYLLKINFQENYHPQDLLKFASLVRSVYESGSGKLQEVRLRVSEQAPIKVKDGDNYYMWVDVEASQIPGTNYIWFQLINVTQRVQAQQFNRDLAALLRISGIPLSVIEVKDDGTTKRVLSSSAFADLLGYPTGGDGMREIGVLDVIEPKHHAELGHRIELFLETGELEWLEAPMRRADGHTTAIDVSARASVINGKTYAIVVYELTRDRVQRMEDMVRRRLAGGVAHDLNNQLTGVLGYLQLMLKNNGLDEKSKGAIELVLEIMDEMKEGIHYFRGASDAVVGGAIDPYPLLKPKRLSMLFGREAQLSVRFAADRLSVQGPRFPITQIISVLLNNAVEAMEEMPLSERRIRVETRNIWLSEEQGRSGKQAGPHWRLSISNNGPSIPSHLLRKLFEKNSSTKKGSVGRGLGLHTVAQLVRERDGFVKVNNMPERGVRFDIYLPVIGETPFELDSPGHEVVLVVDDDPINRMGIEKVLRNHRYAEILLAADGQEALEIIEQRGQDLAGVITDRTMPRMNGDRLLAAIRADYPTLPIILQTGDTSFEFTEDEQTGFLSKPWAIDDLAGKLRLLINESLAREIG